jgi:nitroimidazol reductase NimA-like FMN-containing flavoprotein (pyridoxamine 5'-phosphate oxidase superfamily)
MASIRPRKELEILPEAECWRLLRLSEVGRLAVVVNGAPTIWPLNIAVQDGTVRYALTHSS